jgi:hypothetical protein
VIIHLALTDDPRGLIVDDGTRAILTPTHAMNQRGQLAADVCDRIADCRSTLLGAGANTDLDMMVLSRRQLAAWDHDHLFDGFIQPIGPDRVNSYVLGYRSDLPLLSLNAALHHRCSIGAMTSEEFSASFAHVAHSREGFEQLERRLGAGRRPWAMGETTLLLCPRGCPGVVAFRGEPELLPRYLEQNPAAAVQPALVEALIRELSSLGQQLGMRVQTAATSEQLLEHLARETENAQTLLLAHQHDGWLHLADRRLSIAEVFTAARTSPCGGGWYLAVCGAEGPAQLAGALQAAGRPFVLTGGPVSIVQDQLGFMVALLRAKQFRPASEFESAVRLAQLGRT